MATPWFQMWVRHNVQDIDQISIMQRCDPVLQRFGVLPCAPDGVPVEGPDGTIEVRGYNEVGFSMAKIYLKEQGFVIEREQENAD